jgi:hypothetical protein
MKRLLLIISITFLLGSPVALRSQTFLPTAQQQESLLIMQEFFEQNHYSQKQVALQWAKSRNISPRIEFADGRVIELQYLDMDSLPVYYETRNAHAARTTGANHLYLNGKLRLNIHGNNMVAGVWDGGAVESTHQELTGRIQIKDGAVFNNHATHVGGTIMASGVTANARGMANQASVLSYDWNNDLAEMTAEAAKGLLISNHSYGNVLGWSWSDNAWKWFGHPDSIDDYRFGFYGGKSKSLDQIAYNAPHYLIVWAAGNDRSDTGDGTKSSDGPYDCLGPESVAKNVLVVGAVNKIPNGYTSAQDVGMSSFSSWGPTDDGRIKPDLVGAGVQIYSTTTGNTYGNMSGTSMASPNVTGSLLLLQELYKKQNPQGNFMRAASLRGLAIHTAREAGNYPGPDYQYGWGLLDVEKASRFILYQDQKDFIFKELSLEQGEQQIIEFTTDGRGEIVATICWTDPAGTPVSPAMNPRNRMLVNDLDIKIVDETGTQLYLPWCLNAEAPASSATKGDNSLDNVERINILKPKPGTYKLLVTHKNNLHSGKQDFSLLLQSRDIPERLTYYWVGNSGNWSLPDSWSLSSGGEAGSGIPTIEDHVVFDDRSFTGNPDDSFEIVMNEDAEAFSFSWLSTANVKIRSNQLMKIAGSVFIHSENQLHFMIPEIHLMGGQNYNEIFAAGSALEKTSLIINGEGAWNLLSNLHVKTLTLNQGNLLAVNKTVQTKSIELANDFTGKFDFSHTTIKGLERFVLNPSAIIEAEGSSLVFVNESDESGEALLDANNHQLWDVINLDHNLTIRKSSRLRKLINGNLLKTESGIELDSLVLDQGSEIRFQTDLEIKINQSFSIESSPLKRVKIVSEGDHTSVISCELYQKLCFDYLDIERVEVKGEALFNAGANSNLDSFSSGWLKSKCDEILFSDFSYKYACVGSLTLFNDQSTGTIDYREWNFFQEDSPDKSTDKNPYYTFNQTGDFPVSLSVGSGGEIRSRQKVVSVKENNLTKGGILKSNNRYTSISTATFYQWFINGEAIPEATLRYFDNTTGEGGTYQVMLMNQQCNIMSEPLLITAAEQRLAQIDGVKVYPNPVNQKLHISLEGVPSVTSALLVMLIDQQGRVVISDQYTHQNNNINLEVTGFPKGIYLLRLILDNRIHNEKIIVH